jgi:O-antigen/teichoic acid export membrane protein
LKTKKAIYWSLIDRLTSQGIQFIISIILARLIAPAEFGLIAMIIVFITIAEILVDGGLKVSVIQNQDLDEIDLSTIFYTNLIFAIIISIILWFLAPLISVFYAEEKLVLLIRLLILGILFQAPSVIQIGILNKELNFKKITLLSIISALVSGSVGIIMAYNGFGVYALVATTLLGKFTLSCSIWLSSSWRPNEKPSIDSLRKIFPYSSKILVATTFENFFNNIFPLVIGKVFTPADVSFFQRGVGFTSMIANNIRVVTERVLFPLLSGRQKDEVLFMKTARMSFRLTSLLAAFFLGLLFLVSKNLVLFLIGKAWLPAVPILQILCIVSFFQSFHHLHGLFYTSTNNVGKAIKIETLNKVILVLLVIGASRLSIYAMTISYALHSLIALLLFAINTKKKFNYDYLNQLKDIFPTLLFSFIAVYVGYFFSKNMFIEMFPMMLFQILIFTALFSSLNIIFKTKVIEDLSYFIPFLNKTRKI